MSIKADREKNIVRKRNLNASVRDIYPLPICADPVMRARCDESLLFFLLHCFPNRWPIPFGDAHLDYIKDLEDMINFGGQRAVGMPRGSGKTTIFEPAVIWASITGRQPYTVALAATKPLSEQIHKNIRTELEGNERLYELYPEAIHPFKMLEGTNRRALSQTHRGQLTYVEFGQSIVYGRVGAVSDGCVIVHASMDSSFRGLARLLPDGRKIRPTLVLIDDVLTDKKAISPAANQKIEGLIEGAILKLAGPDVTIACLFSGTIIQKGDVVDTYLNRKKKPMWRGKRTPFFYKMPDNMGTWEKWKEIYIAEIAEAEKPEHCVQSQAYYIAHREAMDAGASVSWPGRMKKGDLSTIYYGMREWAEDPVSFEAEFQLAPTDRFALTTTTRLKEDDLQKMLAATAQGERPKDEHVLTCGIDFNQNALSWQVWAWTKSTSTLVDYGFWPEQPTRYFKMRDAQQTIERRYPAADYSASASMALEALLTHLRERYQPAATLIDCNWQPSEAAVFTNCKKFARETLAIYLPARGKYVGPSAAPMSEWKKLKGEVVGDGWRITTKDGQTYAIHDPNYHKSTLHRLWVNGRMAVYNPRQASPNHHRCWAEHRCSEYATQLTSAVRTTEEWKQLPNYPDNHLLDCEVLAHVANGIIGKVVTPKFKAAIQAKAAAKAQAKTPDAAPTQKKSRVSTLAWR